MARQIEYYFSAASPWAYIGHALFESLANTHGRKVVYKPVFLGELFAETGGLPLAKRHPARQRYRMMELQRWREKRGLNFHLKPQNWPFDPKLADGAPRLAHSIFSICSMSRRFEIPAPPEVRLHLVNFKIENRAPDCLRGRNTSVGMQGDGAA